MYNADRKREYINYKKQDVVNSQEKGAWYFNRVERIEEYLQKDVCDFTVKEIIGYLKSMQSPSQQYLSIIKSYFEQYTRWCQQNNLVKDGQNHFEEITSKMIRENCTNTTTIKRQTVTKSDLMGMLNDISRPCDRFLALAIFEGLGGVKYKEFWNLRVEDFKNGTVTLCTGRKLEVSEKLLMCAKVSSETFKDTQFTKFKESDDRILKARSNTKDEETPPQLYRRIWLQLDRLSKEYGPAFSQRGLKESGRIQMIKDLRKDGETIEETIKNNIKAIEYRYGKIRTLSGWLEDYEWAFE